MKNYDMRLSRFMILVVFLLLSLRGSDCCAQIRKLETQYSTSDPWESDSIKAEKGLLTTIFYVCKDHKLDTLDVSIELLNQENRTRPNNDEFKKVYDSLNGIRKKYRHTDTEIFVINRSMLAKDSGSYAYAVSKDGHEEIGWQTVVFSEKNRITGQWYSLLKANVRGHKYVIRLRNGRGEQVLQINEAKRYPAFILWGVYPKDYKYKVRRLRDSIPVVDSNTIFLFPTVDWQKYRVSAIFDTFLLDGKPYGLPTSVSLHPKYNDILLLMASIPDTVASEYKLVNVDDDSSIFFPFKGRESWVYNRPGNSLIELGGIKPGSYSLHIRFSNGRSKKRSDFFEDILASQMIYYITVRPAWYQTTWFYIIQGVFVGMIVALIMLHRHKRKQKQKELLHRMNTLQLQSYRAQLNPHFIFNALSSIQSLVNRNDNEHANQYLADFSALLRVTLDQHKSEFWTLQDEIELLNKYISLEQLRFRFRYALHIDESIQVADVSFPAMLLQPAVENAIKHGIAVKGDEGMLVVMISAKNKDLEILIKDNGDGFDTSVQKTGTHGISLTRERIAFVNEMNKSQRMEFDIKSSDTGTEVRFYLYNYL